MAKAGSFADKTAKAAGKKAVTYAKIIRSVKSKAGGYAFHEQIVPVDKVQEVLAKK